MENTKPHTVSELVTVLGGTAALGRIIGKRQSTASEIKRRGKIPPQYWGSILTSEIAREQGLTADDLVRIHAAAVPEQQGAAQ